MNDTVTASRLWMLPIVGLLAVTFTIVSGELVIAGLLPTLAGDLGVDIPTAGLLITGYAIGVAITGPALSLLTGRVSRKTLLLIILAVFIAGNILCALAPNYGTLLAARLLMSACHGLYFGVAMVIATQLAPADRKASAVSLVVAGVTIAIILGVPVGTAIGNAFGWRMAFWIIAAAGIAAGLVVAWLIPTTIGQERAAQSDMRAELRAAMRPGALLCYAIFGISLISFFALLAYAVPFVTEASGFDLAVVPLILFALGIASFLGTLLGGRLGDWNPTVGLIAAPAVNVVLFIVLSQVAHIGWAAVTLLCLIWLVGFSGTSPLQSRVLLEAKEAPTLASTLMNTASQIGIALGAVFGGFVISSGWGYSQIPLLSAVFYALGLAGVLVLVAYDRRKVPATA